MNLDFVVNEYRASSADQPLETHLDQDLPFSRFTRFRIPHHKLALFGLQKGCAVTHDERSAAV